MIAGIISTILTMPLNFWTGYISTVLNLNLKQKITAGTLRHEQHVVDMQSVVGEW